MHVCGRTTSIVVLIVLVTVGSTLPVRAASAAALRPEASVAVGQVRAAACTENPFTAGFDAALRARWPGTRITAAVYDERTGCEYRYRGDLRITTASVLKIEIMAAVILRAQRAGRGLTATERARIAPMIHTSDDPAANALWTSVGGVNGLAALDRELGLRDTVQAAPWGLTSTSASDRNLLLRRLVLGEGGPFTAASRATARSFLLDVAPSQQWGITSGVPSSWRVPMKNGFFPSQCCGWRINSSGVVERPSGTRYVATILSDGWSSQAAGVPAVEFVSRVIATWNHEAIGPHLSPARFSQQSHRDVLGRAASFTEEQDLGRRVAGRPDRVGGELQRLLRRPEIDATSGQILRLYLGGLRRMPAPAVWSLRLAQLRHGQRSLLGVADDLAWSGELNGPTTLSTSDYVDRAYRSVMGIGPSSTDRAWWTRRIDGGRPRGELLLTLVSTGSFRWASGRQVQITSAYLAILRTGPSAGALADWTRRLDGGAPFSDLAGGLFQTGTYRARFS